MCTHIPAGFPPLPSQGPVVHGIGWSTLALASGEHQVECVQKGIWPPIALRICLPGSSALQNDRPDLPVTLQCRTPRETNPKDHWGPNHFLRKSLFFRSLVVLVCLGPLRGTTIQTHHVGCAVAMLVASLGIIFRQPLILCLPLFRWLSSWQNTGSATIIRCLILKE
jgi:hypothetical protein